MPKKGTDFLPVWYAVFDQRRVILHAHLAA